MNKTASFFQHPIFQEEECRISGGTVVFSRHGIPSLLLPRDKAVFHGDFVSWNIRTTASNDLMCVDWEYAEEDGIAGFDFAYFILQQAICVFRCPQEKLTTVLKEVLQPNSTLLRQYHVAEEGGGGEFNAYGWTFEEAVQLVLAYRAFRKM